MQTSYVTSAKKPEQLPAFEKPEVAFVGRSNCGKSSLINALLNRRDLARTSSTPGRTQMINFFDVNDRTLVADLPGYGYSATGKSNRADWQGLMQTYFDRENLSEVMFLMDARRKLNDDDLALLRYLSEKSNVRVLLTKADKLKKSQHKSSRDHLDAALKSLGVEVAEVRLVSSLKKTGIQQLREQLFH